MKSFFLKHLRKSLFLFVYLTSSRIMFVTSYLFFNILKVNAIISIPVLLQYFFYFDTLKKEYTQQLQREKRKRGCFSAVSQTFHSFCSM